MALFHVKAVLDEMVAGLSPGLSPLVPADRIDFDPFVYVSSASSHNAENLVGIKDSDLSDRAAAKLYSIAGATKAERSSETRSESTHTVPTRCIQC